MVNDFRNEQKSEKKKNWEKLKFPFVLPFKQFFFEVGRQFHANMSDDRIVRKND